MVRKFVYKMSTAKTIYSRSALTVPVNETNNVDSVLLVAFELELLNLLDFRESDAKLHF